MLDSTILNYYARLKEGLALSDLTMNHTVLIHEKVLSHNLGKKLEPFLLASSCIYLASKYRNTPRKLKQLSDIGGMTRKDIAQYYRILVKNRVEMDITIPKTNTSESELGDVK